MGDGTGNRDVMISYETIFELLRREKGRDAIQELPKGFMVDIVEYTRKRQDEINAKKRDMDNLDPMEIKKLEIKLGSLTRVISELYERREKKILNMALTRSRTKANLVDVANLMDDEKQLFLDMEKALDFYRKTILHRMLGEVVGHVEKGFDYDIEPEPTMNEPDLQAQEASEPSELELEPEPTMQESESKSEQPAVEEKTAPKSTSNKELSSQELKGKVRVKFLAAIPKFFDREMNVLGPFDEGQVAEVPGEIAQILMKKEKVTRL